MTDSLIIVDPIFRGSRLYFSSMAARAAAELDLPCSVVTRTGARTDHYDELFNGADLPIHEVVRVEDRFWYGKIPPEEQTRAVAMVEQLCGNSEPYLYFPGLNEHWPELAGMLTGSSAGRRPTLLVEYHPDYLLKPWQGLWSPTWGGKLRQYRRYAAHRQRMLDVLLPWLRKSRGTRIAVLDERVTHPRHRRVPGEIADQVIYLCDPAPDRQPTSCGAPASVRGSAPAGVSNLLLVGSQSSRKGLSDVIRLCNQHPVLQSRFRFTLVGRLTPETEDLRPQLHKHRELIRWIDDYVSEAEIARCYESADFVMLPYSRAFSGSSGVLGSAVAHGKPVITTEHGLIGHRVRTHELGVSYPSGDHHALWARLQALPSPTDPRGDYPRWQRQLRNYARLISEEAHISELKAQIQNSI